MQRILITIVALLTLIPSPIVESEQITIEDLIRMEAEAHGLDGDLMVRIAKAESSLNPNAKNKRSSASGLFQVVRSTWEHFGCQGDKFDAQNNIKCAIKIMKDGDHHWDESRNVWDVV